MRICMIVLVAFFSLGQVAMAEDDDPPVDERSTMEKIEDGYKSTVGSKRKGFESCTARCEEGDRYFNCLENCKNTYGSD